MQNDFISQYLSYTAGSEVPVFFSRWSAISGLGALLGRQFFINHGHFVINTNQYCMLVGNSGTRKSSAIKMMKSLLQQVGYTTTAAEKTSKEKFLLDLMGEPDVDLDARGNVIKSNKKLEEILEENLWGEEEQGPAEMYIMADEFNDFTGPGNMDFFSLLGTLWDYKGEYRSRIKTGKSVKIQDPTINILGGNTPVGLSICFPTEVIGQGFFSRLILVYAKPTDIKLAFPPPPDEAVTAQLVNQLREIKDKVQGPAILMPKSRALLDKIYCNYGGIEDPRFESYATRRFTHLLKMCMVKAASRCSVEILEEDIIWANTILSFTEELMPKALGEFGRARNAAATDKVLKILEKSNVPLSPAHIWIGVSSDLDNLKSLAEIIHSLLTSKKIQQVGNGYLPCKKVIEDVVDDTVDYRLITQQEKDIGS